MIAEGSDPDRLRLGGCTSRKGPRSIHAQHNKQNLERALSFAEENEQRAAARRPAHLFLHQPG
jgi:hypothetical protein